MMVSIMLMLIVYIVGIAVSIFLVRRSGQVSKYSHIDRALTFGICIVWPCFFVVVLSSFLCLYVDRYLGGALRRRKHKKWERKNRLTILTREGRAVK